MLGTWLYSLKVADWPRAQFSRGELVIPRVCPNCMSEQADWSWPIDHKYPLSNTRYTQTFYYCDACTDLMKHDNSTRRRQFWIGVLLFVVIVGLLVAAIDASPGHRLPQATVVLGMIAAVVIPIAVALLIGVVRRSGKPIPPDALGRRPAAFYTGHSVFDNKHVYRAGRQTWIDMLIAMNPQSADDAEYKARVGQPKPDVKPF